MPAHSIIDNRRESWVAHISRKRLKQEAEFESYLREVRAAHKPKRNFRKLLDRIK